ncbi:MAG: hypothetical protein JSV29_01215, partial [Candidatus Bathyarchaeota archaeon]
MRLEEFFFIGFILIFTSSWIAMLYLYRGTGTSPLVAFLGSFWFALVFSAIATLGCTTIYWFYNLR